MKICSSCQQQNADTEDFCLGCGTDISNIAVTTGAPALAPTATAAPATVPQSGKVAARTLTIGDRSWPLYEGETVRVARADSDQNPDIKLDSDKVSATPLELTVVNDKLQVTYGGTEAKDYSVVKAVKPGETLEAEPGEMIMFGGVVGVVT